MTRQIFMFSFPFSPIIGGTSVSLQSALTRVSGNLPVKSGEKAVRAPTARVPWPSLPRQAGSPHPPRAAQGDWEALGLGQGSPTPHHRLPRIMALTPLVGWGE